MSKIKLNSNSKHSIATRLGLLAVTMATVLLNSHYLEEEGLGSVALLQFGLLLVTGLAGFIAASSVVYVRRSHSPSEFKWFAYGWCLISAFVASSAGVGIGAIPEEWLYHSAILGLLQSIVVFHSQLLIASGEIKRHNILQLILTSLLLLLVAFEFMVQNNPTPEGFAKSLGAALILTTLISSTMLKGSWNANPTISSSRKDARKMLLKHGAGGQTGSILQLLTNRSNLSLLENTMGSAGAGVYSIVYYGVEAVWTVARAIAPMVNNEVAMADSRKKRMAITGGYLKLVMVFTLPLVVVACLIPESVYAWVFGINGVAVPLRLLAPGMVAGAISSIVAHHLSGIGLHSWNALTSALGLVVLICVGLLVIPQMGVCGAAIAASCAYSVQAVSLIAVWLKKA